jgi:tetratricopeptide (TPR) repeat protein
MSKYSWSTWIPSFLLLLFGNSANSQVPIPEDFLPNGRVSEYVQAATNFLNTTPKDRFAPRVAFDLYTLFSSIGKKEESEKLRSKLLLEYPHSFQAGYLITTFEDASKFAKFLDTLIQEKYKEDPKGLPESFCRLYKVGLQRFRGHKDLSESFTLLLKGYVLSQVANDEEIERQIRKNLALKQIAIEDATQQELLTIVLSRTFSIAERIQKLHDFQGDKLASFLKRVYLEGLDPEAANSPEMQLIKVENRMEDKEFSQALSLIGNLPPELILAPKVRYWKGLCYYGLGKDEEALKEFGDLYNAEPNGPWASTVKAFGEGILAVNDSFAQQADLLHQLMQALISGTEVFQVKVVHDNPDDQKEPLHVYLAILPKQNFMEVSFTRGNDLFFAYRTTNVDSTLYFKSEPIIHHFPKPGPILSPTLDVQKDPDGGFNFSAEASIETNFSAAKQKSQKLLETPILNSRNGIHELLVYAYRKQGICPLKAQKIGEEIVYTSLMPDKRKPGIEYFKLVQGPTGKLAKLEFPEIQLTDLQYGTADSVKLSPPAWPQKQVRNHEQMDISLFFQVFSVLSQLVK